MKLITTTNCPTSQGARLRWCDLTPSPLEWGGEGEQIPESLLVAPNGQKTCQERHCGTFTLWAQPHGGEQLEPSRFIPLLPRLVRAYRAAGRHLHPTSPVFLKTAGAGHRLTDEPATHAVVAGVLKKRSAAAALGEENFTGHSFRRGRMQDDQDAGVAPAITQARALGIGMDTYALYTDRNRPTRRAAPPDAPPPPPSEPTRRAPSSLFARALNAARRVMAPI